MPARVISAAPGSEMESAGVAGWIGLGRFVVGRVVVGIPDGGVAVGSGPEDGAVRLLLPGPDAGGFQGVVAGAEQLQVVARRRAAVGPRGAVVDLGPPSAPATGEPAVPVPSADGFGQRVTGDPGAAVHVEHLTGDRVGHHAAQRRVLEQQPRDPGRDRAVTGEFGRVLPQAEQGGRW